MTKEQETIERLEYYLKNSAYKREDSDFFKNGGWEIVDLEIPKAIDTVLSMLKEKDKEIETLKRDFKIVDQECSRLERKEAKQDKIIDLMAEDMIKGKCYFSSKTLLKKHYESKVEK